MARVLGVSYKDSIVQYKLMNKPEFICQIDAVDYDRIVNETCWFIHKSKKDEVLSIRQTIADWKDGKFIHKSIQFNRYLWETFNPPLKPGEMIIHLDKNTLNNCRSNLHLTTHTKRRPV